MTEDKKDTIGGIPTIYWRYLASLFIASVLIYLWNAFFVIRPPEQYSVNYSQFIEQLNAGNIKAVSIKKMLVNGEFVNEVSVHFPGDKKPVPVKYFSTYLPSFQGEGLLNQLKEKNVIISIESAEQGLFQQIFIGLLPCTGRTSRPDRTSAGS